MKHSSPALALTLARAAAALGLLLTACEPAQIVVKQPPTPPPQTKQTIAAAKPKEERQPEDPVARAKADEIINRYIQARGGAAQIHAIKSLRLTGKTRYGSGDSQVEVSFGVEQKRPLHIRSEETFQGLTSVETYDGKEAWATQPFGGRREPFRRSADEAKQLARDADIEGPLVDWREKGHRVDYLGTEEIDGTNAIKLRVTFKDGDIEYRYLDPDALLEIRVVTLSRIRGVERIFETDLGDYEQVEGVWFPFSTASGEKNAPRSAFTTVERAEANVDIDDSVFQFPAAGTKVGRVVVPATAKEALKVPPGLAPGGSQAGATPTVDRGIISGLGARNIGSAAMSGRVAAVAARVEDGKTTLYVGSASGGVWKSLDGGTTFKPVFDKQPVQSIGAIALDPSNEKTVWVGTGESWTRNSVSIGDGIYKSTDGGETWKNMGLPDSERITKILIHPTNGDIVYACVPGRLWSDSADRGVYKTTDGGKSWSLILKGDNLSTGCSGISLDPKDPEVIFAGLWDFRRKGWTYRSGGDGPEAASGSSLLRSADGGRTWTKLTDKTNKGLPAGPWGRVEVTVAPSNAKMVYALIESKDSALFASEDGGATWEKRDSSQGMVWRPFYFARIVVDPKDPDRLFKAGGGLIVSEDGGKSFAPSAGRSHGDWHDIWIDPTNPSHVIGGDDGGLWISHDGGSRWAQGTGLPISQFYHVTVDAKDPYQVYGGLQDNSTWVGDSAYPSGITNSRWENLYGGDGFWAVVDPSDPEAVYVESQGGYAVRVDRRTHAARDIQPKARYKEKLRFNWNTPIHASPTQKSTIYIGAQFLFRSKDRGDTWDRISPDLTTNDPEKQKQEQSGGVTVDNSSAEMHTTIYSISESPRDAKVIWVGTDDGNVQVTKDDGKTWTNVVDNVPGLPKASWVSWVEASRFDAGTAYATFDRHTFGDMTPWVYKTTDYGKSWTRIVAPEKGVRGYAHVVKEDVKDPRLLFVGTEFGLWISVDAGDHWAEFKGGDFPSVAVRDIAVQPRDNDLVIGTHGRGIWIIDDITPLRALTQETLARSASFLSSRPVQQRLVMQGGWPLGDNGFVGQNPPQGAVITYYQRSRHLFGRMKLEVLDASGKVIDTLDASKRRGINRVQWSMQMKPPRVPRAAQVAFNGTQGPRVLPGTYTLRLTKGAETIETKLEIGLDRRASYTIADRKEQFDAAMRVHALFGEMSGLTDRIDATRSGIEERLKTLKEGDGLASKLRAVDHKLEEAKKKIVATKEGGAITGEERIREHLDILYGALLTWDGKPARYQVERIDALAHELKDVSGELDAIVTKDVASVDADLKGRGMEPIPTTATGAMNEGPANESKIAADRRCVASHGLDCEPESRAAETERD